MIKFNETTTPKYSLDISKDYFFFIKDIFNDYSKYLKQYKTLMVNFSKKLNQLQEKFGQSLIDFDKIKNKYKNSKIKDLYEFISVVPKIVQKLADNFNSSVNGLDPVIQEIDKIISEQINIDKKEEDEIEFDTNKNNLIKCYKTIDKNQSIYLNKMRAFEDAIYKYYSNIENQNQNLPKEKGKKDKDKLDNITSKEQLEQYITQIKKIETQYISSFDSISDIENSFNNISQKCKQDLSKYSLDLTNQFKKLILDTTLILKNSFSEPLVEIAIILESLNDLEKSLDIKKIINESFNTDKTIENKKPKKYMIKILKEPKEIEGTRNPNCNIIDLEDGFKTLEYYKDFATLNTINTLYKNFDLIEKDDKFNYQIEYNKIKSKELAQKILSYADNKKKFEETGNIRVTSEEINNLKELLDDHSNRVIFLMELNNFRATGLYGIPKDIFDLFNDLFELMTNTIGRDKDYHSAKNLIILSQTYYHLDEGIKNYIHDNFKKNKIFKNMKFWEEYIYFTIEKEIIRNIEMDKKNGTLIKKTQKESDDRYATVVFSQLVTVADNMISFDCDSKNIKEIIKPIIKHYNINEESITIIDDILHKNKSNLRKSISLNEEIKKVDINKLIEYYNNFDVFGNKSNLDLNNNDENNDNDDKQNEEINKNEILEDIYNEQEINEKKEEKKEENEGENEDKKEK